MPGLTLSDHEWQVFDMPAPGDHYWHWTTGYRVERTGEVDGELRLHLMRNPAWEEEMSQGLPDDHLVDGGRSAGSGQWRFRVLGPRGPIIDWRFGDEMKPTIANAVRDAVAAQGE